MSKYVYADYPEVSRTKSTMVGMLEPIEVINGSHGEYNLYRLTSCDGVQDKVVVVFGNQEDLINKVKKNIKHVLNVGFLLEDVHYHKYDVVLSNGRTVTAYTVARVAVQARNK